MKKLISIALLSVMLLSVAIVCVQADESDYPGVEIMNSYLEEDINHYFLPVAYDLTRIENSNETYYNKVYTEAVKFDNKNNIVVPPIKTVFYDENCNRYNDLLSNTGWFWNFILELDDELYETTLTTQMRRAISPYTEVSDETTQRVFIAPWTLYDSGNLYTWIDLMAMSEDELEALNFKTPDFANFISNVKVELESRGWWKEEYQSKYDILSAHKDDYKNSLDENDSFTFDGENYNFADINYEYRISGKGSIEDIISVNIYKKGFSDIIDNASDDVKSKYKEMFDDIKSHIEYDRFDKSSFPYTVTLDWMEWAYIFSAFDIKSSEQHGFITSGTYAYVLQMYKNEFDLEKVREGVEKFCYESHYPITEDRIDMFVAGDMRNSMLAFSYKNALILNAEEDDVTSFQWITIYNQKSRIIGNDNLADIEDIITDFKNYMLSADASEKAVCEEIITYLESLLDGEQPETGENTVLYIAIAGAAVVCMTALLVRKKKEIV